MQMMLKVPREQRLILHSKTTQLACPKMVTIANGPRVCISLANLPKRAKSGSSLSELHGQNVATMATVSLPQ
jgi:hypothetical protein